MSSDINGVNLFYIHLLAQAGVRYLNTAINTTRGGPPLPEERPGGSAGKARPASGCLSGITTTT